MASSGENKKNNPISAAERIAEARETLKTVKELSDLLNTGLDTESLHICVQLLEAGVNPEALAAVVKELRRETAALKSDYEMEARFAEKRATFSSIQGGLRKDHASDS